MAKALKTVSAREANQKFSKLLARAERGETITITKYGVPVARIEPIEQPPRSAAARGAAIRRMLAHLRKGARLGGRRFTREEIYDRWRK